MFHWYACSNRGIILALMCPSHKALPTASAVHGRAPHRVRMLSTDGTPNMHQHAEARCTGGCLCKTVLLEVVEITLPGCVASLPCWQCLSWLGTPVECLSHRAAGRAAREQGCGPC